MKECEKELEAKKVIAPFIESSSEDEIYRVVADILRFHNLLVEYNAHTNMVSDPSWHEFLYRHVIDSLVIIKHNTINKGQILVDIGSGAGFPGIPLKIVENTIHLYSIESINKKAKFQKHVIAQLNLNNADVLSERAESVGHSKLREKTDVVVARAVTSLNTLVEYALPLLKIGGKAIFLKGLNVAEEIGQAKNAIKMLGGDVLNIDEYRVAEEYPVRSIITIVKCKKTLKTYPRNIGIPQKSPL